MGCLFVLYPVIVFACIKSGYMAVAAALLAFIGLVRAMTNPTTGSVCIAVLASFFAIAAFWMNEALPLKLYPVAVNGVLLFVFAESLTATPMVERFARLKHKDLPEHAVRYCRKVTAVWCVFFVVNGLIAFDTAFFRSDEWWALYNGAISYVLIGIMMAGEFIIRKIVDARYRKAHADSQESSE